MLHNSHLVNFKSVNYVIFFRNYVIHFSGCYLLVDDRADRGNDSHADSHRDLPGSRRRADVPDVGEERLASWVRAVPSRRGTRCTRRGSVTPRFFVIEHGRVRVLDRKPGKDVWVADADAGTFLGDIATFTGEPAIAECVADEPTDVIAFERSALRAMLASWPSDWPSSSCAR